MTGTVKIPQLLEPGGEELAAGALHRITLPRRILVDRKAKPCGTLSGISTAFRAYPTFKTTSIKPKSSLSGL